MGIAPTRPNRKPPPRQECSGWSAAASRGNRRFLYSVDERELTGLGFAVSFTVLECPPSHEDWKRVRAAFFERLRRMGLVRLHWLTEWQRRGVPHLHAAVWLDYPADSTPVERARLAAEVQRHWLAVAGRYGSARNGQDVKPITDVVGWFKYMAKHAARGAGHYQRSPENIPPGWKGLTGRMWGYLGDWPRQEKVKLQVDHAGFYAIRRMVRRWRIADAREPLSGDLLSAPDDAGRLHWFVRDPRTCKLVNVDGRARTRARRIRAARTMLRCPDQTRSRLRGIDEWCDQDTLTAMAVRAAALGYAVHH